ncbi:MAG: hypothetical protein MUC83_09715 [Pirellula sp.]|nr:hypothetical protein [Pirellula sp.]
MTTIVQSDHQDAEHVKQRAAFVEQLRRGEKFRIALSKVSEGSVDEDLILAIHLMLSHTSETESHRMRGAIGNLLYLSPDGKQEAVYNTDGKLVNDGFNDGSYNYFHPQKEPLAHFFFDTTPWMLFGQSRKDPTSQTERVEAWCADLCSGILRARQLTNKFEKNTNQILMQEGNKETIAMFVLILEEGRVDDLVKVLNDRDISEPSIIKTVQKIEAGLKRILFSGEVVPKEFTNKSSEK